MCGGMDRGFFSGVGSYFARRYNFFQVVQLQEEFGKGTVRLKTEDELSFLAANIERSAYICKGDIVHCMPERSGGFKCLAVRLAQEAIIETYTPEAIGDFLLRAARSQVCGLVAIL